MDNEQNLANLSVSLSAKDVNVKDMFDSLKKEALNLQKEISGAFDMSEIKNAVSDMRKMTNELKGATTQITSLSNSMRKSANDLKSISKETGFKKLKKDIDSANQSTKKFDFSQIKNQISEIGRLIASNPFTRYVKDASQIKPMINDFQNLSNQIRLLDSTMKATDYSGTLSSLREQMSLTKQVIDNLIEQAKQVDKSSSEYQNITNTIKEMVSQYNALSDEHNTIINSQKEQLSYLNQLRARYRELATQLTSMSGVKGTYSFNIDTGQVDNVARIFQTKLSSALSGVPKLIDSIKEPISSLIPRFTSLANNSDTAFGRIISAIKSVVSRFQELGGIKGIMDSLSGSFNNAQKSFSKLSSGFKGIVKNISSFSKEIKKASAHTYTFSRMMKDFARNLVLYGFAMRGIMSVVNAMGTTMWGALNTNEQFVASLNNIKANLAVAFMPIYNTILPAINALMSALAGITRIIGSLFASLFGSSYDEMLAQANKLFGQIKANEEAEKGGADAVKDKTKEYKKQLLAVDEINNLTLDQDTGGSGGGGSGGADTEFEQLEGFGVNVDALKKKLEELFQPIKNSWDKYGKGVVDSMKYSFTEVWELVKSIGRSFEEVWLNGTGEQTFDYIFQILTNIFMTIGNISRALKDAWEQNNTGTQIVQALWNAFNNVLDIIERLTSAIRDWSSQADFTNLMNSVLNLSIAFEKLTGSIRDTLVPIFDTYLTPALNYLTEVVIPSVINGISYLVDFFSEHLGSLALIVGSVLGAKLFAPLVTGLQTVTKSPAFSLLSSIFSSIAGAVGVVSTSIGLLTAKFAGMATKIPILGEPIALVMDKIGKAMIGLNGTVLLLAGSFFYLLGSSEEMTDWVNDVVKSISGFVSKIDFGKMAKDFSNKFKEVLNTVATGIINFDWGSVAITVSLALSGIFNFFGNIDFGNLYAGISSVVNSLLIALGQFLASFDFNAVGESIGTMIANLFNVVLQFILNFDWITFLTSILNIVIQALMGLVQLVGSALISFLDGVLGIGKDSVQDLWDNYLAPFGDWIASTFTDIWNTISDLFTNVVVPAINSIGDIAKWIWDNVLSPLGNFISTVFTGIWNTLVLFIKNTINPTIKAIGDSWKNIWDNYLSPFINWVSNTFKPLFDNAIKGIKNIMNDLKSSISTIWNGIKTTFNGIVNFVTGVFTGNWKKAWNGVKSIFKGIWDTFYGIVKAPINLVIGAINAMISGIEKGINYVIGAINKLSFDVPDWVPGIGGQTWGFSIGKVKFGRIPKLEEGGIAYGDTLVNVAEYVGARANPEVIAPLDKLNGMIYDGISELMKNNTNNQFNPNDYDIVTEVELKVGEEQIAKATAKGKAKIEKKTGRPLFNT